MSTLLHGAREMVTRGTDIGARIEGLEVAAAAARGRLDDALVDEAAAAGDRAAGRLRLSAEHTVVAIAGATGSGKSSTFNALTGLELSSVGVRRPTTSWATACVWGREGAEEVLEWLGIPPRHQTMRDSMLDSGARTPAEREDHTLDGVVLLDLPDHDSTEVSHHLEVDRLVQLADLLVWVLDPQKYADAAIHDRYLAPLRSHAGVMLVVLNHIDSVPADRREAMVADVRRLLDLDGLTDVPLVAVSAREGIGLADLRSEIAARVSAKKAMRARLEADLAAVAERMRTAGGPGRPRELEAKQVRDVEGALADAAGVPTVVDAVERSVRQRAGRATCWPVAGLFTRLRRDPLKRLELDLGEDTGRLSGRGGGLPEVAPVQRARVDTDVRALADDAARGLGRPWVEAVRAAATARVGELGGRLDLATTQTDLGVARLPWWAPAVRVLQWLLLLAALGGAGWLAAVALSGRAGLPEISAPEVVGLPLPALLLLGGVVLGVVLWLVFRGIVAATARARAEAADERLREAVHEVAQELVLDPIAAELAAHAAVVRGLDTATRV